MSFNPAVRSDRVDSRSLGSSAGSGRVLPCVAAAELRGVNAPYPTFPVIVCTRDHDECIT